ncbi:MAG: GNAT family N-acetyltransferase [Clostridia bacterium]|nr:GNAT family N-acetyltransferase [Clostridia bacterium]
MNARGELKLVFPSEEYKEQIEEYLKEHFENGEYELAGDGGLDRIKNFDDWLLKVKRDLSEETNKESRMPATLFLGVRKSDNKVIGTIQIRHRLNENLLKNGGHIGDGVRPSERRKGYATEMIRLALEECKKIGINRVLMVCFKDNIGSAKSIINNGGILENELPAEDGKINQRYWISLKKRFADSVGKRDNVIEIEQKIKSINNEDFIGDIYLNNFKKVDTPYMLENGVCL